MNIITEDSKCQTKAKQYEAVLKYFDEHGGYATVREMFDLGINSPTKVISTLRKFGFYITDEWRTGLNRNNDITRYKVYQLHYDDEDLPEEDEEEEQGYWSTEEDYGDWKAKSLKENGI